MKIGFWGGCFNPPSNIHIDLANNLIKNFVVDKVVFVPVNDYYVKKDLEKAENRYNMLKFAIEDYNKLDASDIELNINEPLKAQDIFKIINDKYINDEVFFIMGSDNFNKMPQWYGYNEIINKYKYIIIERQNHKSSNTKNVVYYDKNIKEDISSSQIRELIQKKQDVSNLLDKKVYEYILKNNLYSN